MNAIHPKVPAMLVLSALVLIPSGAAPALAQDAAAEALFRAGRAASARGDHAAACAKYRESYRLEKAPGTLLNIAVCEEALGQLAAAWQHLQEVLYVLPAGDERVPFVRDRIAALDARLPRLTLRLAASAPQQTRVRIGEVELSAASLDVALPIDPGEHAIAVSAPGRQRRRYSLHLEAAQRATLEVEPGAAVMLAPAHPVALPSPAPNAASDDRARTPAGLARPTSDAPAQRMLAYVGLGIGGASLIASAVAAALTIDRKLSVDEHCNRAGECDPQGLAAADSGRVLFGASVLTLAFGVVVTGTSGYLLWAAPDADVPATRVQTTLAAGAAELQVRHAF